MSSKETVLKELEKIIGMTLELRDKFFFGKVKNRRNNVLDVFNNVIWEMQVPLKNLINSLPCEKTKP